MKLKYLVREGNPPVNYNNREDAGRVAYMQTRETSA